MCSTEDVVLIKGAAVASNTSNLLDLVEAQGSHLREIIKCLPRRLALLEHLLSLGKVACFSHQEHRVSLQPIPSYLAGSTWQAFVTPRIWCWLWATQVQKMILVYWVWHGSKTHQRETILTRHRKGVLRADYPNQTPKGHDTRGTKKPSQGQKASVSLRPSQIPRQGTEGSVTSPHDFPPQLYLLPDDGVICSDTFCLGWIPENWETPSCTNCSLKVRLLWWGTRPFSALHWWCFKQPSRWKQS